MSTSLLCILGAMKRSLGVSTKLMLSFIGLLKHCVHAHMTALSLTGGHRERVHGQGLHDLAALPEDLPRQVVLGPLLVQHFPACQAPLLCWS